MPSLNLSLPGMPGLAAGLFPMASNQLPSVTVGGGGDFAAMMAPPEAELPTQASSFLDAAPVLPSGNALPPVRQIVAGPPEPLPDIPVENVMIGASGQPLPSAVLPKPIAAAPIAPADEPAEDAGLAGQIQPASLQPVIGECVVETRDFHGASRRALARASLQPAIKPGVAPAPLPTVDADAPVVSGLADDPGAEPTETEAQTKAEFHAQPTAEPQPAPLPPPFAPVDWSRPPVSSSPRPAPEDGATAPSTDAGPPLAFEATRLPGRVTPSAKPAGDSISMTPDQAFGAAATPKSQHDDAQSPVTTQTQSQQQHAAVARPVPMPQGSPLPAEIAREVAELVRTAIGDREETSSASDSRDSAPALSPIQASAPSAPLHRDFTAVHRPVIDTSRAEWLQSMIEKIAEMPQVDGKREAQIRLSPDALGTIDVRIEQRQDRLHVTMNTENPQARQLLAEAAPRLQEMAEARGLRLGQTGIGGGESQDRRPAQEQPEQNVPLRPRPAEAAADSSSPSDGDLIA